MAIVINCVGYIKIPGGFRVNRKRAQYKFQYALQDGNLRQRPKAIIFH